MRGRNRPRARRARGTLVTGRPRARLARWTLVTCGNRPRARLARWTLVTSGNRPRARRARGTLVTGRNRPRARLARVDARTGRNRPRARRARGTLVTAETALERDKWRRCVSRTNPLLRSCGLLGFALLIWKQPGSTLKMFMLSTLGQTKGRTNIRTADPGLRRLCLRLVSDRRQTHQVTEACPHRAPALFAAHRTRTNANVFLGLS